MSTDETEQIEQADQIEQAAQIERAERIDRSEQFEQADDRAFDVPDPPQTGDRAVDEAISAVAHAVAGPLEEQLAVYEAAHRTLQDRLADVEG